MATSRRPSSFRTLSIVELDQVKQSSKKLHGSAVKTTANYHGHLTRGKQWLEDLMKGSNNQDVFGCPRGLPQSSENRTRKWGKHDLIHAFDLVPTCASPWALASFLTFKCFHENRGISTAEGIHAAFKKYWDNSWVTLYFPTPISMLT